MPFDEYFDQRAGRFASFYKSKPVSRALGRGALFERLDFAIDAANKLHARRVLDVGCGSGPLFAPLAKHGIHVTGIEPAPGMVDLARRAAGRFPGLVEVVPIGWEGIDEWRASVEPFDLATALGVFDYVPDPAALLRAMAGAATHVVASFPSPGARTQLRNMRYGMRGVSVYGYSKDRITSLCRECDLVVEELKPLARAGYALRAGPQGS